MNWIAWKLRKLLSNSMVAKLCRKAGLAYGATHHPSWNHIAEDDPKRLKLLDWWDYWDTEKMDRGLFRFSLNAHILVGSGITHSFFIAEKIINKR